MTISRRICSIRDGRTKPRAPWTDFLNKRVKVSFLTGTPWCEGFVLGYHADPTLILRLDDGSERAVSTQLPIEVVEEPVSVDEWKGKWDQAALAGRGYAVWQSLVRRLIETHATDGTNLTAEELADRILIGR